MPFKFHGFGRRIVFYYERYPLAMNCIAGGSVYGIGELIVESSNEGGVSNINWRRISNISLLGSVENGLFMSLWYNSLTKLVGAGVSTRIVLTKCLLDQAFFATQQDGLFLLLCAIQSTDHLEQAFVKVKKNFLTTWLNDCSIWPLVNFVGFAVVPAIFLPTYMSFMQLFWQLYLSSIASSDDTTTEEVQMCEVDGGHKNYFLSDRAYDVTRDSDLQQAVIYDAEGRAVYTDPRLKPAMNLAQAAAMAQVGPPYTTTTYSHTYNFNIIYCIHIFFRLQTHLPIRLK